MLKSYVINLGKRYDRLEIFKEKYYKHGTKEIKLEIIKAIDGSDNDYLNNKVPENLKKYVKNLENCDHNKTNVHATVFSHLKAWKNIIDEKIEYGIIFEDDIKWKGVGLLDGRKEVKEVLVNAIALYPDDNSILYFGVGDCLPIHTNISSESLLRSQEKVHVTSDLGGYGEPNFNSAYVFDWLGCFSYVISYKMANILFKIAEDNPIDCAIDSWLKKLYINGYIKIYLTVPLLTYTSLEDSNTENI